MLHNKWMKTIHLLIAGTMLLAACSAPATTPVATKVQPTTQVAQPTTVVKPTQQATAASTSEAQPTNVPITEEGKSYRMGIFSDLSTVNYWAYNGPNATVWNGYVLAPERLGLYTLADKTFQLVPQVADGMPERPLAKEGDFFVSTVKMKQGIMWNDGTPLTATDVAFTANAALQLKLPGNWATLFDPNYLDHVEAVDDTTVKFYYTKEPGLAVHEYNALQAPILSAAFWQPVVDRAKTAVGALTAPADNASDDEKSAYQDKLNEALNTLFAYDPQGEPLAGAYEFKKWETGAFAQNDVNPDYYFQGANISEYANGGYREEKPDVYNFNMGDVTGQPSLNFTVGPFANSSIYTLYGSQDAAVLALDKGEIDYLLNPLGLQRGLQSQLEGQTGVNVIENPTNGFRYLSFNMRKAPMDDAAFRQAVATIIDKEFVTKTVLQGVAFPLYSFVPKGNSFWYSDDVTKWGLKDDGTPMSSEERLNAAIDILKKAGYTWEGGVEPTWDADNKQVTRGGTLIMPDGTPVPALGILAPSAGYDPLRSTFAVWIEQYLNDLGIPAKADLVGFNTLVSKVFDEQDFDMFILGWSLTIFPDYLRDFFHSERAVKGDNNAGGYSNPAFDKLSDDIKACTSLDDCKQIADNMQKLLSQEVPYVVLFDTGIVEGYRSTAVDYPYTDTIGGLQFVNGLPQLVEIK